MSSADYMRSLYLQRSRIRALLTPAEDNTRATSRVDPADLTRSMHHQGHDIPLKPPQIGNSTSTCAQKLPQAPQVVPLRQSSTPQQDFSAGRETPLLLKCFKRVSMSEAGGSPPSKKTNGSDSWVDETEMEDEFFHVGLSSMPSLKRTMSTKSTHGSYYLISPSVLHTTNPAELRSVCSDSLGSSRPGPKEKPERSVYHTIAGSITGLLGSLLRDDEDKPALVVPHKCKSLTANCMDKDSHKPLIQRVQEGLRRGPEVEPMRVASRHPCMPQVQSSSRWGQDEAAPSNGADGGLRSTLPAPKPEKRRLWLATHLHLQKRELEDRKMLQERKKAALMNVKPVLEWYPDGVGVLPAVADVGALPAVAEVGVLPAVAEVGVLPAVAGVGALPDVAEVGVLPDVAEVGALPAVAEVGVLPAVAEVGVMPAVAEVGVMPAVAGVGVLPAVAEVGVLPAVAERVPLSLCFFSVIQRLLSVFVSISERAQSFASPASSDYQPLFSRVLVEEDQRGLDEKIADPVPRQHPAIALSLCLYLRKRIILCLSSIQRLSFSPLQSPCWRGSKRTG
eukprot:gene4508-14668_t